jgi:hypothetical protein
LNREPYILDFVTQIFMKNKKFKHRLRFSVLVLGEYIQNRVARLSPEHLYTREVCVRFAAKKSIFEKYSARSNSLAFVVPLMLHGHSCTIEGITGSSKKMDGISNRHNLTSTGRIYTFGILKCSEKFKVLDLA